jgi:cytochrome c5
MKEKFDTKVRRILPLKTLAALSVILFVTAVMAATVKEQNDTDKELLALAPVPVAPIKKDSAASVKAFENVYKVLMSPRCMNCHPSGDIPLQGDDSHLHTMAPRRGTDGKGVYAMKCSNCHQPANVPGLHTPPGNPDWHLPPATARMVFQGRTAHQLAKQLIDPKQNGGKNMEKLIEHADDGLVLAGWNPGEGRTLPPMSHAEFKKAWLTWLKTGAYAPKP